LAFTGFPGEELGAQGAVTATDANGNMFVLGQSAGTVQVNPADPTQVVGNGLESTEYVAKYSEAGELLWVQQWLTVTNVDFVLDHMSITPTGDVVLGGQTFTDGYDVDPTTTTRSVPINTLVVIKLKSSDGSVTWVREIPASANGGIQSIDVMSNGNIVVGGSFDSINLDGPGGATGLTFTSTGANDFYVALLDSNGVEQWAVTGSTSINDYVADIELTATDEIVMTTAAQGIVTLRLADGTTTTASSPTSLYQLPFVWKLSPTGVSQWTAFPNAGSGSGELGVSLLARSNGQYLLRTHANDILQLSSTGAVLSILEPAALVTSMDEVASGAVVLAGYFNGTQDLDPTSGVANYTSTDVNDDGYVTLLSPTLAYVSSRIYEGVNHQRVDAVVAEDDGGWTITGLSIGSASLNLSTSSEPAIFTPASGADTMLFIVRYNADGSTTVPLAAAPTALSYVPGNKRITLTWTDMPNVGRYVVKNAAGATVCETVSNSCEVTGLRNGRLVTYIVQSYSHIGVVSTDASSVRAMAGFTIGVTTAKVRKKVKLTSVVSTPSKGEKTWKVTSGQCRISGTRLVMPNKKGRCTLQLSVSRKKPYPKMSTKVIITVSK
jgi:hypothetical protein